MMEGFKEFDKDADVICKLVKKEAVEGTDHYENISDK